MENKTIGFSLDLIKTEQFAVFQNQYSEKKKVELNTSFVFQPNLEDNHLAVKATFQFEQGKNVFIKLEVSCYFLIEKIKWAEFSSESSIRVPVGFVRHLSMLTVGTSRGILHCKTEGTAFNSFVLPTINVAAMLQDDLVFKFTD